MCSLVLAPVRCQRTDVPPHEHEGAASAAGPRRLLSLTFPPCDGVSCRSVQQRERRAYSKRGHGTMRPLQAMLHYTWVHRHPRQRQGIALSIRDSHVS